MNKAVAIWNSLDLSNQTNLECARAWFMEGFAHGEILKEYTDEEIIKELELEIERLQDQLNEFLVAKDLATLRKAQD